MWYVRGFLKNEVVLKKFECLEAALREFFVMRSTYPFVNVSLGFVSESVSDPLEGADK